MTFDGNTYDANRDQDRLENQLDATFNIMNDGRWRTIPELTALVSLRIRREVTTQSVSARLRDFRKEKFGGHRVDRESLGGGVFQYRLIVRAGGHYV